MVYDCADPIYHTAAYFIRLENLWTIDKSRAPWFWFSCRHVFQKVSTHLKTPRDQTSLHDALRQLFRSFSFNEEGEFLLYRNEDKSQEVVTVSYSGQLSIWLRHDYFRWPCSGSDVLKSTLRRAHAPLPPAVAMTSLCLIAVDSQVAGVPIALISR